ncbi:MAG TPA: lipopolysaccharide heptosyltransferase I [Methylomirabilota bacterium]|nr:lipopolysaccharide heptosyltransferase I [Methylomirabilota bacterium]
MTGAERIALVKLSALGDVVHALPAAHALRARLPRAELTWIVERREAAILTGNPDLDHVIPVDTRLWRREFRRPGGVRTVVGKVRGLVCALRGRDFGVALDFQGNLKSGLITRLTRAPVRVGFALGDCRESLNVLFTNRRVKLPAGPIHVVEENLALLAAIGLGREAAGPPVYPIPADSAAEATVAGFLEREGLKPETPLVALNPGTGGAAKRWPPGAYRRLGDELALRLSARVLLCWGPGEEALARAIAGDLRAAAVIPPATSIPELVALLRRTTLVVGGDTGPIHIAAALGVPTVALYGPTDARRNGPWGPRLVTVQSPTGRMDGIAVEGVLAAAETLFR